MAGAADWWLVQMQECSVPEHVNGPMLEALAQGAKARRGPLTPILLAISWFGGVGVGCRTKLDPS